MHHISEQKTQKNGEADTRKLMAHARRSTAAYVFRCTEKRGGLEFSLSPDGTVD